MTANVIEIIKDYIVKAGRGLAGKDDNKKSQTRTIAGLEEDPQRLQEILDGMGTGTARIIIDREASRRISEDFKMICQFDWLSKDCDNKILDQFET